MSITLYAWACPAAFTSSPVDHTWVTAFDNLLDVFDEIGDVVTAGKEYWYCWGDYHARGISNQRPAGFLGSQPGDPGQAHCVAVPNVSSSDDRAARGTIFLYGIHGVCHQIANQVLFTTKTAGVPLTVHKARGYWLSDYFWNTYGTNGHAWRWRAGRCDLSGAKSATGMMSPGELPDLFLQRAAALLGDEPDRLSRLLGLRGEVRSEKALQAEALAPSGAEEINQRNWEVQQEAANVLGDARFRQVFAAEPRERLDLVDPDTYRQQAPER